MAKLPPMESGKAKRRFVRNQSPGPGGKLNFEGPNKGRAIPKAGFTDETKGKSAGSGNVRRTGGSRSKGS